MCLDNITHFNPKKTSGFGYKLMFKEKPNSLLQTPNQNSDLQYKLKKWYCKSPYKNFYNNDLISASNGMEYTTGFHIFTSKRAAQRYRGRDTKQVYIVKVKYKEAHTIGMQFTHYNVKKHINHYSICVVANKIMFLEVCDS